MEIKESVTVINLTVDDITKGIQMFLESEGYTSFDIEYIVKSLPNKLDRFTSSFVLNGCICQCNRKI